MNVRHDFIPCPQPVQSAPATVPGIKGAFGAGRLRSALFAAGGLTAIWAGLHWSDPASWIIGVPTILLGSASTLLLPASPPPRLSVRGAFRFAGFAARGITLGAVDVTRRSLRPELLNAGCLTFHTRLPQGRPRRMFAVAITLLPGTLTKRMDDETLIVHALDAGPATMRELTELEDRVAQLFGLEEME